MTARGLLATLLMLALSGLMPAWSGECTEGESRLLSRLEYWNGRSFAGDPRACGEISGALRCLVYNRIDLLHWAGPNTAGYFQSLRDSPLRPRVVSACTPLLTAPECSPYGDLGLQAAEDLAMFGVKQANGHDILGILVDRSRSSQTRLPYLALAAIGDSRVLAVLRTTYDSLSVGARDEAASYEILQLVNCLYHLPGDSSVAFAAAITDADPDTAVVARARHVVEARRQR
ncbi:MAG: hypothetical protein KC729_04190 [Candidatus Eisenbacteria bacterium]|uniref:HEAT repeat domain-containing protein n=1 Tax=Eiseniibacteriota bacterium TaxID=2212470 RepID=A0A956LWL4_UNCEI|nr:hypothetical protein [Candidatus Eisenbacteria bacterium]